ncbi:MAG: hypothetical protein AAF851_05705 [Myxococcota bacterium]
MADAKMKSVLRAFIDSWSRRAGVFGNPQFTTDLGPATRFGDAIDLPNVGTATVVDSDTRAAPEAADPSVSTLTVNQRKMVRRLIDDMDDEQFLRGNYVSALTEAFTGILQNTMDDYVLGLILAAAEAAGNLNSNEDAVTVDDFSAAEAALEVNGQPRNRFRYIVHPAAVGKIRAFVDYIPAFGRAEEGSLGVPAVQSINGIPLITSPGVGPTGSADGFQAALLYDVGKTFTAAHRMPMPRLVPDPESGGSALQVRAVYGAAVIAGSARVVTIN